MEIVLRNCCHHPHSQLADQKYVGNQRVDRTRTSGIFYAINRMSVKDKVAIAIAIAIQKLCNKTVT